MGPSSGNSRVPVPSREEADAWAARSVSWGASLAGTESSCQRTPLVEERKAAHNIQTSARERKGSQQPEGVQVSQHRQMALRRDKHDDGNGNGEQQSEMWCSPQPIALLDKRRKELHA